MDDRQLIFPVSKFINDVENFLSNLKAEKLNVSIELVILFFLEKMKNLKSKQSVGTDISSLVFKTKNSHPTPPPPLEQKGSIFNIK